MHIRRATIANAYLPWFQRKAQWWILVIAALLGVAILILRWSIWGKAVAAVVCIVALTVLDYLVVRHIRATYPRPEPDRLGPWLPLPDAGTEVSSR